MNAQPYPAITTLRRTTPLVLVLVAAKLLVERLDWEFIEGNPVLAATIVGAAYLVGMVVCGRVQDHKEVARLRTRNAAAIEAIRLEGAYIKRLHPTFDADGLAGMLGRISATVAAASPDREQEALAALKALNGSFLEMDRLGVSPEYVVGLKQNQALIRADLMRGVAIGRVAFPPAAYTLVETVVAGLIALLMFTPVASASTDVMLLGFTSLILLCLLRWLRADSTAARLSGVSP